MRQLPQTLAGTVTPFKGNGRKLGYPTANVKLTTELTDGIYFGYADMAGFTDHPSLVFIGTPTTMGDVDRRLEVHLLDIPDEDYYELPLSITIHHYHRPNQTFGSIQELEAVLKDDEAAGRQWFAISGAASNT